MNTRIGSHLNRHGVPLAILLALAGCGGGGGDDDGDDGQNPPPAEESVTLDGIVSDGPVSGGTIFVFAPDQVQAALEAAESAENRAAALADADPLATLERDPGDADHFTISVPDEQEDAAVFVVFDSEGAEDEELRDVPPNLESVVILGAAGTTQRLNITTHTTLIAQLVRARLDPDGDGTPLDTAGIESEIDTAQTQVLEALGHDDLGRELFPEDASPLDSEDDEQVHEASATVGLLARSAAAASGEGVDEVMHALAVDSGDGDVDGSIPGDLDVSQEVEDLAATVDEVVSSGDDEELDAFAVGPCSTTAVALRQSCDSEVVNDLFVTRAACADEPDDDLRAECLADAESEVDDAGEECQAMFDARLALCADLADAAYEPAFGPEEADNFVNPLEIGYSVTANPYLPLVPGNQWFYGGTATDDEGETIAIGVIVTVTNRTKLIDGVTCIVVTDEEMEDGVTTETTEDWFAQDVDGNVWYCGEVSQELETFEGDDPPGPELVSLEGSWKAGRDGAGPGIIVAGSPEVGQILRQEAAWGTAEDVMEITDLDGSEQAPGAFCNGTCLVTVESSPLEPDVEETKYYMSGIGLLVELAEGERVELTEFHPALD